jgi:hypothetical protein
MAIGPDVAFAGTVAEILVEVAEPTEARIPLNVARSFANTSNPVPAIVTAPPTLAMVGVNEPIERPAVGAVTVNEALLVAVPPGVVTVMEPVAAPVGTMTVS